MDGVTVVSQSLLSLLKRMLPEGNEMVSSEYEAKKKLSALGVEYQKKHASPNDCILYRNEYEKYIYMSNL